MKKQFLFFILLLYIFFFFSCGSNSKRADRILQSVEDLIEQHPDSALILLDSINNPYELKERQQALYNLLWVQAEYKNYKDISHDTTIFNARDYFKKAKDIKHWALATFYSGHVLEAEQKPQKALNAFMDAESIATSMHDPSIVGFVQYNIGDALFQSGLFDDAISKYKQAAGNFIWQEQDYSKGIMSISNIGTSFVVKNEIDSALFYFNKALLRATVLNDSTNQARVLQNIGVTLLESGKNEEAKEKLMEAQEFCKDYLQQARINLNLAKTYVNLNRLDSATFYITRSNELAQKTNDKTFQESVFYQLSLIDEKKGDYKASLEHYKEYTECLSSIYKERQHSNSLDVEKKYNFELIHQANNQLLINNQRIVILLLVVVLGFFLIVYLYFRKRRRDEKAILLATQEIYQLKSIINNPDLTGNSTAKLKETLAKQFGILQRIALLEDTLSNEEKEKGKGVLKRIHGIVYGESDKYNWSELINVINDLYEGYADKLHNLTPNLKEMEFRICCLSKAGLNNSEIAGLLKTTTNAIQLRKTHIRKIMKMQEKSNFVGELDKLVCKS